MFKNRQALFHTLISVCSYAIVGMAMNGGASAIPLVKSDGAVVFEQVDFRAGLNSRIAEITVDLANTKAVGQGHTTPFLSGFVNIADSAGNWVVQNVPVLNTLGGETYDHPNITTNLDLFVSDGTDVTGTNTYSAVVDYSPTPLTAVSQFAPNPAQNATSFDVGQTDYATGGFGSATQTGYLPPPNVAPLVYLGGAPITGVYQPGHKNEQCATNQCGPMSIANSLQYLEDTKGLNVPDNHTKGLQGDMTLVGLIDSFSGRTNVTSRTTGDGVSATEFYTGKLAYIADAGLHDDLKIKHQGTFGNSDLSVTIAGKKAESFGQGTTINFSFILNELMKGEDVEMCYRWATGGHCVELIGAGEILGLPFVLHRSDHTQTDKDPMDMLGTMKVDFSFLLGNTLVDEKGQATVALVSSQSVPEPGTLAILGLGLAGLGFARRKRMI